MAVPTLFGSNVLGPITEPAGTPINRVIPPLPSATARVSKVVYTPGATSHTLTCLRALGRTRLADNASSGQPSITLHADPGPSGNGIAANDWLVIRNDNGSVFVAKVSSVSSLDITLTANLVSAISAIGSSVWFYGIASDTDPRGANASHPQYSLATGAQRTLSETWPDCVVGAWLANEPILLQVDNATNAGTLDRVHFHYER